MITQIHNNYQSTNTYDLRYNSLRKGDIVYVNFKDVICSKYQSEIYSPAVIVQMPRFGAFSQLFIVAPIVTIRDDEEILPTYYKIWNSQMYGLNKNSYISFEHLETITIKMIDYRRIYNSYNIDSAVINKFIYMDNVREKFHKEKCHFLQKGDIINVDFGLDAIGSEQEGVRPAIIVQNNIACRYSPIFAVSPFTTKKTEKNLPTHYKIENYRDYNLRAESIILFEQVQTVSYKSIGDIYAWPRKLDTKIIDEKLIIAFDINIFNN